MSPRLTPGERRAIASLSQLTRSIRLTAAALNISTPTLDRAVMGCRLRPSTVERIRAGLSVWTTPPVHVHEVVQ